MMVYRFAYSLLTREGFAVAPETGEVFMESGKYLQNLTTGKVLPVLTMVGILLVISGVLSTRNATSAYGIWLSGPGSFMVVLVLFLIAGLNNTAFYPSSFDLQSSLTIQNASSSKYTLSAMAIVSLLIPFVFAYIWYAWKAISNKKITAEEMKDESHVY